MCPGHLSVAIGIAGVVAVLTAGCSSGHGSASREASSSGGAASSAFAGSGDPIKIGVISSNSGSQASSSSQASTVAPAWADYVNDELGGIGAHPVQVVIADDKGDPASAQAAGKSLIGQGVVALLVGSDNLLTAYDQDFISSGVPMVSGPANSAEWYSKPDMYPTPTYKYSGLKAQLLVAKEFGKATKVANVFCSEVPACAESNSFYEKTAAELGLKFTSQPVSSTATSYTAECLSLQQHEVDYALLSIATAVTTKFVQDCQAQGYDPGWGTSEQSIGPALFEIPNVTMYGPAYAFPSVADSPAVKTFVRVMEKYAKADNWREGTGSFAWGGLEMIRKALTGVQANESVTAKTVAAGLEAVRNENLGGLLANKVTFTAGRIPKIDGNPCYFIVEVKDGKTVAPNGSTPVCPNP